MKVLIEIPHTGIFHYQFVHSFPLMIVTALKKGIGIEYELRGNSLVYKAREEAVKNMLSKPDIDAILFLDSDMVPSADMLVKLVEHDKPIVSALAFRRVPDYEPCIFKKVEEKDATIYHNYPKGLIGVEGVGMACCLIKREVFENIPQPWFYPDSSFGEDLSFCRRAKGKYPIYCDTELICKHIGSYEVGEEHYRRANNV